MSVLKLPGQPGDERLAMHPVPIKLETYVRQLDISDPAITQEERQARTEVLGMVAIMERNLAAIFPIGFTQGRMIWEVRYPRKSLFLNGPRWKSAWGAIQQNYIKNDRFKKILAIEGGRGESAIRFDKIADESVAAQRKAAKESEAQILNGEDGK